MNRRTSLAVLALGAFVACGPAGSNFIGTWAVSGGTFSDTCDGVGGSSTDTGNFTVAASATGNNIVSTDSDGCNLQWTPNGNTATLVAGQTCSGTINGVTFQATYSSGTMSLTSSTTLAVAAAASGTADGATCTFSNSLSASLVSH
jgi:hypothetical protein